MRYLWLFTLLLSTEAFSFGLFGGVAAVESGDGYFRPALSLKLDSEKYFFKTHYYGRDYGPVLERSVMAAVGKKYPIGTYVQVDIGLAYCIDHTRVERSASDNMAETSEDIGLHVSARLFTTGSISVELEWGGNLYASGIGTILLANERRQIIGLNIGVTL